MPNEKKRKKNEMKKKTITRIKWLSNAYLETRARSEGYMALRSLKPGALSQFGWEPPTSMLDTWVDGWSISLIVGAKALDPTLWVRGEVRGVSGL